MKDGIFAAALAVVVGLAVSGCAAFGGDALAVHGVGLEPAPAAAATRLPVQLLVAAPRAADPLTGTRIAYVGADGEYAVLPGVRWRESPPEMFRSLLIESLEASGSVASSARTSAAVAGDVVLEAELRRFELVAGDPVRAIAQASVLVVRTKDGRALGTIRLSREVAVEGRGSGAGIAALSDAMNALVADARRDVVALLAASP
jgi:ABC-type uncharacterized transport system auxiliary subunit